MMKRIPEEWWATPKGIATLFAIVFLSVLIGHLMGVGL